GGPSVVGALGRVRGRGARGERVRASAGGGRIREPVHRADADLPGGGREVVPGGGRPGRGRLRRGRRWSDHRRVRPRDQARDRARDRRRDGGVLRARVLRLSGTANEPPEKAISAAAGSGADERTSREAFRGARGGPGGGGPAQP